MNTNRIKPTTSFSSSFPELTRRIILLIKNQTHFIYNYIDYDHKEYESHSVYKSVGLTKNTHNTKMEQKSYKTIIGSELNLKQFLAEGFYWTPAIYFGSHINALDEPFMKLEILKFGARIRQSVIINKI